MKRVKESGAAFRKKKKAKEEEATKNEGALLKFIQRTSTPAAEVAETKDDIHAETEESEDEVDIANVATGTAEGDIESVDAAETVSDDDAEDDAREVEELERQPLVGAKTDTATDFTDVGLWPVKIDHEIRAMLVRQGSAAVQHLDCEFKEVARPGTTTQGDARKLAKKLFFSGFAERREEFENMDGVFSFQTGPVLLLLQTVFNWTV